jgi:hypothetical protein
VKKKAGDSSRDGLWIHGAPPKIQGNAKLIFEVELSKIDRKD